MKDPNPIWNTETQMKPRRNKIDEINRPVLSDEEKITQLILHVRSCDEACMELTNEATELKRRYDQNAKAAGEARAELLKYGIQIDNQFGGITI